MPIETAPAAPAFLPRSSGKPELVEPVLVEAEVVRELVEDGNPYLLLELGGIGKRLDERQAEDANPVRQLARPVAALGQRHPLVEPEEVGIVGMLVLDRQLEVPDLCTQLRRQGRDRQPDMLLEGQ